MNDEEYTTKILSDIKTVIDKLSKKGGCREAKYVIREGEVLFSKLIPFMKDEYDFDLILKFYDLCQDDTFMRCALLILLICRKTRLASRLFFKWCKFCSQRNKDFIEKRERKPMTSVMG